MWTLGAMAATPSVNGANVFALPAITDAEDGTWTILSGVVERNGSEVGHNFNAALLLELNNLFYHRNTSNNWYEWSDGRWVPSADPRVISANGASIGVGAETLVDSDRHVWALPASAVAYVDGTKAGESADIASLIYHGNVVYSETRSGQWSAWSGSSWSPISGSPVSTNPGGVSASGSTIGVDSGTLVDSAGNVWTLTAADVAYWNGVKAGNNYNSVLALYYSGVIYTENTSGNWYAWNGADWTKVAADPRGTGGGSGGPTNPGSPAVIQHASYSSPVCPASNPGCTPGFVINSGVTFSRATTRGNTIWVAATVSDYAGAHAISVMDSQGNAYHKLDQGNDRAPGYQSVAQFYASNIQGGTDTVTVEWSSDNYKGVIAAEIGGLSSSPLVGHAVAIQDGNLGSGSDNVSSNAIAMGSLATPGLVVALTMDTDGGGSDIGGTGNCAVPAGNGFTSIAQVWNWSPAGQPACNLATFEAKSVTGTGNVAGAFTSTHLADPYVTVATLFH